MENMCWPSGIAALDQGFPLLTVDKYYEGRTIPYDYEQPYQKGTNRS